MTSPVAAPSGPPGPPAALIIRSVYVITMDPGARDIPAGDVFVAGGRIAAAAGLATPARICARWPRPGRGPG